MTLREIVRQAMPLGPDEMLPPGPSTQAIYEAVHVALLHPHATLLAEAVQLAVVVMAPQRLYNSVYIYRVTPAEDKRPQWNFVSGYRMLPGGQVYASARAQ